MKSETMQKPTIKIFHDGRMDTHNAAKYLGLTTKTLAQKRCDGTGPCFIKRGRIFYYRDDLDAWISESKKVISTAQARQLA